MDNLDENNDKDSTNQETRTFAQNRRSSSGSSSSAAYQDRQYRRSSSGSSNSTRGPKRLSFWNCPNVNCNYMTMPIMTLECSSCNRPAPKTKPDKLHLLPKEHPDYKPIPRSDSRSSTSSVFSGGASSDSQAMIFRTESYPLGQSSQETRNKPMSNTCDNDSVLGRQMSAPQMQRKSMDNGEFNEFTEVPSLNAQPHTRTVFTVNEEGISRTETGNRECRCSQHGACSCPPTNNSSQNMKSVPGRNSDDKNELTTQGQQNLSNTHTDGLENQQIQISETELGRDNPCLVPKEPYGNGKVICPVCHSIRDAQLSVRNTPDVYNPGNPNVPSQGATCLANHTKTASGQWLCDICGSIRSASDP